MGYCGYGNNIQQYLDYIVHRGQFYWWRKSEYPEIFLSHFVVSNIEQDSNSQF